MLGVDKNFIVIGMHEIQSHADVITLWKTSVELASALEPVCPEGMQISPVKVRAWKRIGNIPVNWFHPMATVAVQFGHPEITIDLLARLAKPRRPGSGRPRTKHESAECAA